MSCRLTSRDICAFMNSIVKIASNSAFKAIGRCSIKTLPSYRGCAWPSPGARMFHQCAIRQTGTTTVAPIIVPMPKSLPIVKTRPIVGWWFLGTGALVFSTVIVGGLTRLTESGLSMVDWSLLGSRPPATQEEWQAYFEKYQQFPEYKMCVFISSQVSLTVIIAA